MSGAPPPVSVSWLRVTSTPVIVTVVARPGHWVSHWAPELRRAVRCGGESCEWCDRGIERQLRVVVGVAPGRGQRQLFEFRERHRPTFERLYDLGEDAIGVKMRLWKRGSALNSPIEVELREQERESAHEWGIEALIETLGLPVASHPVIVRSGSPGPDSAERKGGREREGR